LKSSGLPNQDDLVPGSLCHFCGAAEIWKKMGSGRKKKIKGGRMMQQGQIRETMSKIYEKYR
jgi:hypothetical protein